MTICNFYYIISCDYANSIKKQLKKKFRDKINRAKNEGITEIYSKIEKREKEKNNLFSEVYNLRKKSQIKKI